MEGTVSHGELKALLLKKCEMMKATVHVLETMYILFLSTHTNYIEIESYLQN